MMIFINAVYKEEVYPLEYAKGFVKLLNPVAPHIAEELWHEVLKMDEDLSYAKWPEYDEAKTIENEKEIGVQVNGKLRASIVIADDEDEESIKEKALSSDNVKKHIDGKTVVKIIVIKGRIVNIVVK